MKNTVIGFGIRFVEELERQRRVNPTAFTQWIYFSSHQILLAAMLQGKGGLKDLHSVGHLEKYLEKPKYCGLFHQNTLYKLQCFKFEVARSSI